MKFDDVQVGKAYELEDGSKAIVVNVAPSGFSMIRVNDGTIGQTTFLNYDQNGQPVRKSGLNGILGEWVEPKRGTGFVNIFENGTGKFYRTREEALKFAKGRVAFYVMKWEENHGIDPVEEAALQGELMVE